MLSDNDMALYRISSAYYFQQKYILTNNEHISRKLIPTRREIQSSYRIVKNAIIDIVIIIIWSHWSSLDQIILRTSQD